MAPPYSEMESGFSDEFNKLTVHTIAARRAENLSGLPKTVAAASNSDSFKGSGRDKPLAKRWDGYLSLESQSREPSHLKAVSAKYLKAPCLISLGGGIPPSEHFPLESINIKIPEPGRFSEKDTKDHGIGVNIGKYDISKLKADYDLSIAMNYGQGMGGPPMIRWVTEHTEIVHDPPYADWGCTLTVGSSSALDIAFRMLTVRGDCYLTEEYTYVSAVDTGVPMGLRAVGVKVDNEGLLPADLDKILSSWDSVARKAAKPTLLYTVPTGQNPTGATQSYERRREIYKVAQKHHLYIIEDEPYYFLQMEPYPCNPKKAGHKDVDEFLKELVPSYLSLDVDGRVMRMDSFSKVVAPGFRTGWITASKQIIERFVLHSECSVQNPAGLSQVTLHKILDETWGHHGFLGWLMYIRQEYTQRRDVIVRACEKHLPRDYVSWDPPMAGMFMWIKVDWRKHPLSHTMRNLLEVENELFNTAVANDVLILAGSQFRAEQGTAGDEMFYRATFASATAEDIGEAIRRFGLAVRIVFQLPHGL